HDLRIALRGIRKAPGLSAAVILTLALGVGLNTSLFSIVEATLLRPLPFAHPDRLLAIFETRPNEDFAQMEATYPNLPDWRAGTHSFDALAGWNPNGVTLSGSGGSELVPSAGVTGNFFSALGVRAERGRTLEPADDAPDAPRVVVLSQGLWRR